MKNNRAEFHPLQVGVLLFIYLLSIIVFIQLIGFIDGILWSMGMDNNYAYCTSNGRLL